MNTIENINSEDLKKPCSEELQKLTKRILDSFGCMTTFGDDWTSEKGAFNHFIREKLTGAKREIITLSMCKKWCNRHNLAKEEYRESIVNEFAERLNEIFNNDFIQRIGSLMMPIAVIKDEVKDIRPLLDECGKQYVYFDMSRKISMKTLFEKVKQHVDANEIVVLDNVENVPDSLDRDMIYKLIISALMSDPFYYKGETIDFNASHVVISGKDKVIKDNPQPHVIRCSKTVLLHL